MIAYIYNEITKEFCGELICQKDPIQSKKQGKDVYLLPQFGTFDKPLVPKKGKAIVFENGWVYKNDYRNKKAYNLSGIFVIDYIGDLHNGDKLLTEKQIKGLEDGSLIFKDGEIIPYVPTIQEQIEALERQVTDRNIREAILGDDYAKNKMARIEAEIAELRKKLLEMGE